MNENENKMTEETFMAGFREHYEREKWERPFSDYEPAYRLGRQLAGDHEGKSWTDVEANAEREWEHQHPRVSGGGIWEDMKEAVYEGWNSLQSSFGNEQPRHEVPPNVSDKR